MTSPGHRPFVLGVDIGGTFTDVVIVDDEGAVHIGKGLSTPDAFERGIFTLLDQMLDRHGLAAGQCRALVHGSKTDEWQSLARKSLWDATFIGSQEMRAYVELDYGLLKAALTDLGLAK